MNEQTTSIVFSFVALSISCFYWGLLVGVFVEKGK